jgi:hypothetical protein
MDFEMDTVSHGTNIMTIFGKRKDLLVVPQQKAIMIILLEK